MSGYSDRALNYAFDMIKNVLNSPIVIENKIFRLRDLDRSRRMSEMKFFIPLKNLNALVKSLKNIFKDRKELDFCERLNKMKPDTIKRYLIGFIDLVFEFDNKIYVIDWKTNYLGESLEDYSFENMHREVISNDYFLQFSIYQLAVYKYIKSLSVDLGIGECFYIFMRGFKPENNKGLYRYSFSEDELDELARGI
jgi:exodeoxyribonuclease V beta subunit